MLPDDFWCFLTVSDSSWMFVFLYNIITSSILGEVWWMWCRIFKSWQPYYIARHGLFCLHCCCCCCSALCFKTVNPGCLFSFTFLVTSLGPSPQSSTQCQQSFPCCTACLVWLALGAMEIPFGPPWTFEGVFFLSKSLRDEPIALDGIISWLPMSHCTDKWIQRFRFTSQFLLENCKKKKKTILSLFPMFLRKGHFKTSKKHWIHMLLWHRMPGSDHTLSNSLISEN